MAQLNQGSVAMHYGNGWMGGGMWLWTLIGVLLVVLIGRVSRK
jgi:hypothetical protein